MGDYTIKVTDSSGNAIYNQQVTINDGETKTLTLENPPMTVSLGN